MVMPNFDLIAGSEGSTAAITDAQVAQGMDALGDSKPTKGFHNDFFGRADSKSKFLADSMKEVALAAGTTFTDEQSLTEAVQAIADEAAAGATQDPDGNPLFVDQDDLDAAILAHEAKSNPHPGYATESDIQAQISAHEAESDPHPLYATDADLQAEATARANGDSALQQDLSAEATARGNADASLQANIDAEASARAAGDANLQAQVDTINNTPPPIPVACVTAVQWAGVAGYNGAFSPDSPHVLLNIRLVGNGNDYGTTGYLQTYTAANGWQTQGY